MNHNYTCGLVLLTLNFDDLEDNTVNFNTFAKSTQLGHKLPLKVQFSLVQRQSVYTTTIIVVLGSVELTLQRC